MESVVMVVMLILVAGKLFNALSSGLQVGTNEQMERLLRHLWFRNNEEKAKRHPPKTWRKALHRWYQSAGV